MFCARARGCKAHPDSVLDDVLNQLHDRGAMRACQLKHHFHEIEDERKVNHALIA